jgi:hypothetical protein
MVTLRDYTPEGKGKTSNIHIRYQCDLYQYPNGKPIDPSDNLAKPNEKVE